MRFAESSETVAWRVANTRSLTEMVRICWQWGVTDDAIRSAVDAEVARLNILEALAAARMDAS